MSALGIAVRPHWAPRVHFHDTDNGFANEQSQADLKLLNTLISRYNNNVFSRFDIIFGSKPGF